MTLDLFEPTTVTQKNKVNAALRDIPPHKPGIYTMYDRSDRVLYVGKAKNLHKRVTSYRYSRSAKVQRMIAHVDRIRFEVCPSETDAILLENLLIRSLRPPFNHANKKPETYYYISVGRKGTQTDFRLSMHVPDNYAGVYGCFKGHLKTRRGLGALLKLLYVINKPVKSAHFLPGQLLGRITPMHFRLQLGSLHADMIDEFLKGSSCDIIEVLEKHLPEAPFADRFTQNYFDNELEMLRMFYILGPNRNYLLKKQLRLDRHLIQQHELDDMHVLMRHKWG